MAPKKKDGKKDGKKDKAGEASGELTEKDLLVQAQLRIESLEQQLVWREEKTQAALAGQKELQERVAAYHADFEQEKNDIFDISADMTRQYKGMQEQLVERITQLSNTVQDLQDKLDDAESHLAKTVREKDEIIAAKDEEISQMKAKMEDMAREFGGMLKETLDKMRERIELSSTNLDVDVVPDGAAVEAYGV